MKTKTTHIFLVLLAVLLNGCTGIFNPNAQVITPSEVIITTERDVSGFHVIEMQTIGRILLSQGQSESLIVSGSDNLVPHITTTVSNGVLVIGNEEGYTVYRLDDDKKLTFTIVVKDLTALTINGAAGVEMASLATPELTVTMNGAGKISLDQLTADSLSIVLQGLGDVKIAGEVLQASIQIPGAGTVSAPDLKIGTADVSISGLGNATLWVTDQLNVIINGSGNISYYGNPHTSKSGGGLGKINSLGDK
jgi:hypothetical protein